MNEQQAQEHGTYSALIHYIQDDQDLYFRAPCCENDKHAIEQATNYAESFGIVVFSEVIHRFV